MKVVGSMIQEPDGGGGGEQKKQKEKNDHYFNLSYLTTSLMK